MGSLVEENFDEETKEEEKVPETMEEEKLPDEEEDLDVKPAANVSAPAPPEPLSDDDDDIEQPRPPVRTGFSSAPRPEIPQHASQRTHASTKKDKFYASKDPFAAPTVPKFQQGAAPPLPSRNTSKKPKSTTPVKRPVENGAEEGPDGETPKKREINPNFKELRETGQWGQVSNKEKYIAIGAVLALLIGVVVAVVVIVTRSDDSKDPEIIPVPPPTPTMSPTTVAKETQLNLVIEALLDNPILSDQALDLPISTSAYEGLMDDSSVFYRERALSWLLLEDERDARGEYVVRFALAALYFNWETANWGESWLTSDNGCTWEGISCNNLGEIQEIDLKSIGLEGPIPPEMTLLTTLESVILSNNAITGELDSAFFRALPQLAIIYLDSNALTGEVPIDLDNGALTTLFIQYNEITGRFPIQYCPRTTFQDPPLSRFAIDCDKMLCSCCDPVYNCYYSD